MTDHHHRDTMTLKELLMTILARLASLESQLAVALAALAGITHPDTGTGAAVDNLDAKVDDLASSVGSRLDAIEGEIGTDPATTSDDQPEPVPQPETPPADAAPAADPDPAPAPVAEQLAA